MQHSSCHQLKRGQGTAHGMLLQEHAAPEHAARGGPGRFPLSQRRQHPGWRGSRHWLRRGSAPAGDLSMLLVLYCSLMCAQASREGMIMIML